MKGWAIQGQHFKVGDMGHGTFVPVLNYETSGSLLSIQMVNDNV